MRWDEAAEQYCSIARTLGVIGERWTLLIIREAFAGVRRFDDFQAHLHVARNVLTDRLQRLVEAEILEKRAYQEKPVRYEYRLTERGRDLYAVLMTLMHWGDKWLGEGKGPPLELVHQGCGEITTPKLVCSDCGGELHARNCRLVPGPGLPRKVALERERELERIRALRAESRR